MKTLKITLLSLVALMVPASAFAATGGQVVTGKPADTITISASGAATWASNWDPSSATNDSNTTTLTVKSNRTWGLQANADGSDVDPGAGTVVGNPAGSMRRHDGTSYVLSGTGVTTVNPLRVNATGPATAGFTALTTTAATLTNYTGLAATADAGTSVTVQYRMDGDFGDLGATALGSDNYRADVTWTATQGL